MTELLLVRHGESTWNAAGRIQGQTASPELTELGRRQAYTAVAQLVDRRPRRLLTSDLVRARQFAQIIGEALGLQPEPDPLLRERHYGTFQGWGVADAMQEARSLTDHQRLPGGESLIDVRHRWETFLARLDATRGPVVVVTHGNLIAEAAAAPVPENGSVTRFLFA